MIREKQWRAWTLFTKIKNSIQKQNSPFRNEQAKRQKNLVQLIDLWLQRAGLHPGGARAGQLWSLLSHLHHQLRHFTTTALVVSNWASVLPQSLTSFIREWKQPTHRASSVPGQPSCFPPHNIFSKTSLELAKKTHVKSSGLVEEQEARAVGTSASRGMNAEARIPHKARERAHYSKRTINKEKN